MNKHRSFVPSDFSLRELPGFLVVYVVISAVFVLVGLASQALPPFWRGTLLGVGLGFAGALVLLRERKPIDLSAFPEPSEKVRQICDDPNCTFPSPTFVEAVKAYREETGTGLAEATALLKTWIGKRP